MLCKAISIHAKYKDSFSFTLLPFPSFDISGNLWFVLVTRKLMTTNWGLLILLEMTFNDTNTSQNGGNSTLSIDLSSKFLDSLRSLQWLFVQFLNLIGDRYISTLPLLSVPQKILSTRREWWKTKKFTFKGRLKVIDLRA